jgi:MFS family permease
MLPLALFRSRQFVGANATTLGVYGALGGALFLVVLHLQRTLHYGALAAGAALLPVTVLMLTLSRPMGRLAQRIGPRLLMTVGPLLVALAMLDLARVQAGDAYVKTILAGMVLLGLGLATTVAPLTAAVLAAVDDRHVGVGSAFNNAVARLAGLLAVAALPRLSHFDPATGAGYASALRIAALCALAGGVVAALTIRTAAAHDAVATAATDHPCHHPCVRGDRPLASRR